MTSPPGWDDTPAPAPSLWDRLRREIRDIRFAWGDRLARRGTLATALVLLGSFTPAALPNDNVWRGVPVIGWFQTTAAGRILSTAILLFGVVLLVDVWLRMRPGPDRPPLRRGTVWLWSLPLLLAPPLLSFDAYSYAAQGEMVSLGFDPYTDGPGVLDGSFRAQVDNYWLFTPAPYGPLSLQIQHLIVVLTGHNAYLSAMLMRVPAFLGVLLISVFLPRLALLLGYQRESTVWLAVLNPLVVLHLVGGAHNDSLMIGLMVLGLWLAATGRLVVASFCVAAAASIKQPAAAAILAVAALHTWRSKGWTQPTNAEVLRRVVPAVGVFLAGFLAIGEATGLGFGWIGALGVPGQVRSMLAPFTALGAGFEWALAHLGSQSASEVAVPVAQRIGTIVGLAVMAWLVWKYKAKHPVRTLGWILLAFVVTSPTIMPWYLLWGGLLFAMCEAAPSRQRLVVWGTAAFVVYSAIDAGVFKNTVQAAGVTAMLALIWIATGHNRDLDRALDLRRPHGRGGGRSG
jgi:hypothetical protein